MTIFETILTSDSLISGNETIINQLFPNLWVFVAHTLATILLLILLFKLAWAPTKRYIAKRTQEIQKNVKEAEQAKIEAEKNLEESKMKILESKNTASQIIETAELEADEKRKKIELAAINKANHIERESLIQLKKQEEELSRRMNVEASKLALETAEIFLSQKINEDENKKLVDKIVNDLSQRIESNNSKDRKCKLEII